MAPCDCGGIPHLSILFDSSYRVECGECGKQQGWYDSERQAVETWNREKKTMSYFDGVKVGDKLWSAQFGWGVVGEIRGGKYPIGFEWRNGECLEFYDMDGKAGDDELQTLFWDEVKFTPPPRPHRKVWKNGWVNIYQENKSMRWGYIFNTIESAIETSRGALGYITTTPITWEEEE